MLKHAATELGVCSTYAMGRGDDLSSPVRLTGCGEAAHPSAEVSLTKALLEYANSRARKAFFFGDQDAARAIVPEDYWAAAAAAGPGEQRATEAMTAWRNLTSEELRRLTEPDRSQSVAYADIIVQPAPDLGTPTEVLAYLLDRLAGHEVLTTATRVGEVVVAKTLVTELEVESMSYGRVGELGVAAMLAGDLGLVRIGDGPTGEHAARVCLTPAAEERLGGPVWYSYAAAERIVGPLYPLYREPPRHSVSLQG